MSFDSKEFNYEPDELFAGTLIPVYTIGGTLLTDATVYPRGAVLGKITASGKYKLVDSAAVDGSENPVAVLLDAVDATAADKVGTLTLSGDFNANALTYGGSDVSTDHEDALRILNIYTYKTAQPVQ